MPTRETLRASLGASPRLRERWIWAADGHIALAEAAAGTRFPGQRATLRDRSVLLRTQSMLAAAAALIDLDGLARRIVICPPDLADEHLAGAAATAGVEVVAFDALTPAIASLGLTLAPISERYEPLADETGDAVASEWVMFTSGTTGPPKMVVHSLDGLTGAIKPEANGPAPVWGTFYDIRRYGGLQILLRAILGRGSLVLTEPSEALGDFLARLAVRGVTHLTGTPSHWRRVLMSPEGRAIAPDYVRLSGEIADQAVLDALKARFPRAKIGHAYASTEAGVGFEVNDGREGFPASLLDQPCGVEMRIVDGALQLRSRRTATRYVGDAAPALADADGFVDTGDMVERRGDRFHFTGRRGGVINVGGLKVHPEEIEAVINRHPAVQATLVRGRRSPITGAIIVADVVLGAPANDEAALKAEIVSACRRDLAPYKAPTSIRFVASLAMTAGGKLERKGA